MTAARTEPKWSDCPTGKVMMGMAGLILVLLGTLTVQMRALRETAQSTRERVRAVEVNVQWLCKANGADLAANPPRPGTPAN
jgi:hypothetical protein